MNAPPVSAAAAAADPSLWERVLADVDAGDMATIAAAVITAVLTVVGALIAAAIAARVAINGYRTQQQEARRQQRATFYAEAVRAVEDYVEAPYRIRRRDGSAEARRQLTQQVSDIKSRISFYSAWMEIHGTPAVDAAYRAYYAAARAEAGQQMTLAWRTDPVKDDKDVPQGAALTRTATDDKRAELIAAMKASLDG